MPIEIFDDLAANIIIFHLSGELAKADYTHLASEFEQYVAKHGKLRILLNLTGFHGWKPEAMLPELKFDFKHLSEVQRMAVLGDKAWEHGMIAFTQPFTKAPIRYFDTSETEAARAWLTAPAQASA